MELVKKTKKSKKRRHRSSDFKKSTSLIDIKIKENCEVNGNSMIKGSVDKNDLMRHQFVQTDNLNLEERLENRNLLTEKDEEIKNLTEKLQHVTSKLYESKNAYTSLKQDFNKAQKLLCSEIGENVTVAGLTSQPGAWRGRAEQIQQLQQKISELQGKISESETATSASKRTLERRSSSSARIFDKERKQQLENLSRELKVTEAAQEMTKKKLDASRARIAVLENELSTSKKTIGLLNEKTIHDNQIIETLHNQLKAAEVKSQERENEAKRQKDKLEREIVLLKCELEASEIHLKNAKRQMDEKDKEIEIMKTKNGVTVERPPREIKSPNAAESREASEYIAIGVAAEAERERLLELVTVLNQRLDKERNEFERLSESFRKERSRAAKLDTKLQKLELERVGLAKVNTGSYRLRAPRISTIVSNDSLDSEEMRQKFELLQEECLTLKTRLAAIQKDKAADLAAFKKMLEQTRKIFKDAYQGKMSNVGCHSSVTI